MGDKLRIFEAFAGYGSQSIALRNIGVDYEVVAISEIDKFAIQGYEAIHGKVNNLGDISKINVEDIPTHDLFTYSFPCQDISVAGKREGIVKGETRSGLLYECERIIEYCRPKYLLLENVKNLVSKKFKPQFDEWLEYLESLGYTNYWQVLNAKNYGVPQNRERVFVVSILGEHEPFEWPTPIPLDKCIADILEDEVDDKYYVSKEIQDRFRLNKNIKDVTDSPVRLGGLFDTDKSKHQAGSVWDTEKISPTLDTMQGGWRQPCIVDIINIIGKLDCKGWHDIETRVYNTNGVSPTIETRNRGKYSTMQGGNGAKKIICEGNVNPSGKGMNGNVFDSEGLSPTLTTNKGEGIKILIPQATKKGYIEMEVPGICDLSYPNSKTRRGRVQEDGKICPTLTTTSQDICYVERTPLKFLNRNGKKTDGDYTFCVDTCHTGGIKEYYYNGDFRIRKLTPRECFRLMGMRDDDIDKIQGAGISNSQQYKLAGNSIVVDVLETIFRNLFL